MKKLPFRFFTGSFSEHGFFLSPKGQLYCFGKNSSGQLGTNDVDSQSTPYLHPYFDSKRKGKRKVKSIACGVAHSLFLLCSGDVLSAGRHDQYGRVGQSTNTVTKRTEMIGQLSRNNERFQKFLQLETNSGTILKWSTFFMKTKKLSLYPAPVDCDEVQNGLVKEVFADFSTSFFLRKDGLVFACGECGRGKLGIGIPLRKVETPKRVLIEKGVKRITSGWWHSLFLMHDGKVFGTGSNDDIYGIGAERMGFHFKSTLVPVQIKDIGRSSDVAIDITKRNVVDIQCGADMSYFLIDDGTLEYTGTRRKLLEHVINDVVRISSGMSRLLFQKKDGSLFTMQDLLVSTSNLRPEMILIKPKNGEKIIHFCSCRSNAFFFTSTFKMFVFGENGGGNLMTNDSADVDVWNPARVGVDFMKLMKKEYHASNTKRERFELLVERIWKESQYFLRILCLKWI